VVKASPDAPRLAPASSEQPAADLERATLKRFLLGFCRRRRRREVCFWRNNSLSWGVRSCRAAKVGAFDYLCAEGPERLFESDRLSLRGAFELCLLSLHDSRTIYKPPAPSPRRGGRGEGGCVALDLTFVSACTLRVPPPWCFARTTACARSLWRPCSLLRSPQGGGDRNIAVEGRASLAALVGQQNPQRLVGHAPHAAIDRRAMLRRRRLEGRLDEPVAHLAQRLGTACVGLALGEMIGIGPFQQPRRGAPVAAGGPLHELFGVDVCVVLRQLQIVMKVIIALGRQLHGAERNANDAGGFRDRGALVHVGDEFGAFGVGEFSWPAWLGRHGGALVRGQESGVRSQRSAVRAYGERRPQGGASCTSLRECAVYVNYYTVNGWNVSAQFLNKIAARGRTEIIPESAAGLRPVRGARELA
jgi:hypothetical protein